MTTSPSALPPLPSTATDAADAFGWRGTQLCDGIGLALSGGDFRAMLFHAGALLRMNELGLLAKTARIASVSGGSITAGLLAVQWTRFGQPDAHGVFPAFTANFLPPMLTFAKARIDMLDVAIGLLPFTSAADRIATATTSCRSTMRGCRICQRRQSARNSYSARPTWQRACCGGSSGSMPVTRHRISVENGKASLFSRSIDANGRSQYAQQQMPPLVLPHFAARITPPPEA